MNTYDARTPAGREPREGDTPRPVQARPGSARDAVYASRYRLIAAGEVSPGLLLGLEVEHDPDPEASALDDLRVAAAIEDETPPEARVGKSRRRLADQDTDTTKD